MNVYAPAKQNNVREKRTAISPGIAQSYALAGTFIWIGAVCAISFLEAWLKFRAPGITLPLGLGIGRLVFSALNKVEWMFAIVLLASAWLYARHRLLSAAHAVLLCVIAVLAVQTVWLLPALDARAELYITGQPVPPSLLHVYFVIAEVIKTALLTAYGISLFKYDTAHQT
ncbi:hypothetical protein [Chitinophaga sp.]|uniref:hypothetical protein n=1 Tax=Chitinophaga sp. TaxID=1869181 RepID=UPI0031E36D14